MPGYYDADGTVSNGCELHCPLLPHATCTKCDASTCFQFTCEKNCCSSADFCSSVRCDKNYFDEDGDASNGCEVGCPKVPNGHCSSCNDAHSCNIYTCEVNHFEADGNVSNGCERTCPKVQGGHCTACQSPLHCNSFTCHTDSLDVDGLVDNGCEVTCDPCTFANKTRTAGEGNSLTLCCHGLHGSSEQVVFPESQVFEWLRLAWILKYARGDFVNILMGVEDAPEALGC
eukprot:s696_g1.t1